MSMRQIRWSLFMLLISFVAASGQPASFTISDASLLRSSYFGQGAAERSTAAAIMSNGRIVLAGTTEATWQPTPAPSLGSQTFGNASGNKGGFVAIFSPDGATLLYWALFAPGTAEILALALGSDDSIYLAGTGYAGFQSLIAGSGTVDPTLTGTAETFIAKLAPDAQSLIWGSFAPGQPLLSLASGDRPVIGGKTTVVFNQQCTALDYSFTSSSPYKNNQISAIVVDASRDRMYLLGTAQLDATLKTPILEAVDLGAPSTRWRAYSQSASAIRAQGLGADSQGIALGLDRNGRVLALLTADGGNTVLSRDSLDVSRPIGNTVLNGAYQNSYGSGGGPASSFVGVYHPDSGAIVDGTFLHGTTSSGTNTTAARTLVVDEANRVYVAGITYCCFPSSNAPAPLSPIRFSTSYANGEAFLAIFQPDLNRLEFGSYMGGTSSAETYSAIALRWGGLVLAGDVSTSGALVRNPYQGSYGGGTRDGLWAVLANGEEPAVDAGPAQQAYYGETITVGQPLAGVGSYAWEQISGPMVTLNPPNASSTSLIAPSQSTTLTLRLTASNFVGTSASDTVAIVVLPVLAVAGSDQRVTPGSLVRLNGSASKGAGTPTYQWTQQSGTPVALSDATAIAPTFIAPATMETLSFQLRISNGDGSDTDVVSVQVRQLVWVPQVVR